MTNKTQALGRRLIGALRNENVIAVVSTSLESVSLVNAKTGKTFYSVNTACVERYGLINVVFTIKQEAGYPAPKVRTPRVVAETHGAPKYVGISMGSFKPGNLSADF